MDDYRKKYDSALRTAARELKEACDAIYNDDMSCSGCPAHIVNDLSGISKCYFTDFYTEPHDWEITQNDL